MGAAAVNHLVLTGRIAERGAMRYTPAGLPALDLKIEHESTVLEAGQRRQVKAALKAVAFGTHAERLAVQELGSEWRFQGFLASPGSTRYPVLHIQDFQQD